jgi:tRNA 2-selenouridine synthase SelU
MEILGEVTAELYKVSGEHIRTFRLGQKTNILQMAFLNPGVYYIRISGGYGTIKLIKL